MLYISLWELGTCMGMASTSLKVLLSVQRGLFKIIVRDCGSVTKSYWDQALLALRRSDTSIPEIQSLSCSNRGPWYQLASPSLHLSPLCFIPSSLLFLSASKFLIQSSFCRLCLHFSIPPLWPPQWSMTRLISFLMANSKILVLLSQFSLPSNLPCSEDLKPWWEVRPSAVGQAVQGLIVLVHRGKQMEGERFLKSIWLMGQETSLLKWIADLERWEAWLHCLPWNNVLSLCRMFEIWISI